MLKLSGTYVSGSAWALNEPGHIVGWFSGNEDTWGHAFLHDGAAMTDLGTLPGKAYSIATSINALDEVIGYSFGEWVYYPCCGYLWTNNIQRAFYYRDGAIIDLTSRLPEGAGVVTVPIAINDAGRILAPVAGQSVVLVPPVTADADADGKLDLLDYGVLAACLGGPGAESSPPTPMLPVECVRLFDLDLDYDVDLHDFVQFEAWMTHPGQIMGTVEYAGAVAGTIRVRASDTDYDGFEYETALSAPGPFAIKVWRTGDYNVSAFVDSNVNGVADPGEPFAPCGLH
jgi:probable HAF family extracellular repeat protein